MHASTASAHPVLYRILQHSLSPARLANNSICVNSLNCIVDFGTAKRHRLRAASTSPGKYNKNTTKDLPREIFLPCIIPPSNYIHEDGTFPLIAASQKILPTSKGDAVHWLQQTFFSSLRFIISCSQFTHIILQTYVTLALHSSHITNFHYHTNRFHAYSVRC